MNTHRPAQTFVLAILIPITITLLLASCSSDDPVAPAVTPADVDEYISGLPAWAVVSPQVTFLTDTTAILPPDIDWSQQTVCTTTQCSIEDSPADVITFDPDSEILYLGSLIQGGNYRLGSMLELPIRQRAPMTFSINLLGAETSATVENPSLSTVQQAIGELVLAAENSGLQSANTFSFETREFYTMKQAMMSLRVSYKHLIGSVASNLEVNSSDETHTIASYMVQKMFTTSMETPQSPGDVFSDALTQEILNDQIERGRIGPGNLPVYVSNIVWGRIAMVTMTSTHSEFEMQTALEASYGALEGELEAGYRATLADCTIKVMSIGGEGVQVGALIEDIKQGNLGTFFDTDLPLTSAAPISYTLRSLADTKIAYVGDTASYDITTCGGVSATRYTDQNEWTLAVQGLCAGTATEIFYTTNDNMELAYNETGNDIVLDPGRNSALGHKVTWPGIRTGYPFDFFLESMDIGCPADNMWALVYEDEESGDLQMGNDWLSIGDVDNWQYDDFRVGVVPNEGVDVFAIGFMFGNNTDGNTETWNAYGEEGLLINTMEGLTTGSGSSFLGYVSTVPLTCVQYDEGDDGDDVFMKNFYLGYRVRE